MAKTQYSIKMDYTNAKREVNQLKDLANWIAGTVFLSIGKVTARQRI